MKVFTCGPTRVKRWGNITVMYLTCLLILPELVYLLDFLAHGLLFSLKARLHETPLRMYHILAHPFTLLEFPVF